MIDSIYITIGASQIKEHGYQKYLNDFANCDGDNGLWYYKMSNLPVKDFVTVYIVIGNKVRWKARLLEVVREPREVHFDNGSVNEEFKGIILFDFESMPKPHQQMKGFQGFRYNKR